MPPFAPPGAPDAIFKFKERYDNVRRARRRKPRHGG
jgi:hypothetical protein